MQSNFFTESLKRRFNLCRAVVPPLLQKVQNHDAKFVLKFNTFFNQYETMMEHFCKVSEFFELSTLFPLWQKRLTLQIFDLIQLQCPTIEQYLAAMQLLRNQRLLISSPTIRTQSENTMVKMLNSKNYFRGKYAHVCSYHFVDDDFKATAATSTAVPHF